MNFKEAIALINSITNSPTIESLKSFLFDAQQKNFELLEKNAKLMEATTKLQTQIAKYHSWEQEKEKYEIVESQVSTVVYRLKGTNQLFCPVCFNKECMPIHLQPSIDKPHRLDCKTNHHGRENRESYP